MGCNPATIIMIGLGNSGRNCELRIVAKPQENREAPPGFEPGMVDLQSTALATWRRRPVCCEKIRGFVLYGQGE